MTKVKVTMACDVNEEFIEIVFVPHKRGKEADHDKDAKAIAETLLNYLPSGTYEALFDLLESPK